MEMSMVEGGNMKTGTMGKKEEEAKKENREQENKNQKEGKKKRGRKRKDETVEQLNPKDQNKFFIDVSKEPENKELILNFLTQANDKSLGREITFKDIVFAALPKLNSKDIEKLQESCLSEMEKVERALADYNKKNDLQLSMGEFLVRKLGIN